MLSGETQPGGIAVRDVAELLLGEPAGPGRRPRGAVVIALVLVHQGLDVSADFDLRDPARRAEPSATAEATGSS